MAKRKKEDQGPDPQESDKRSSRKAGGSGKHPEEKRPPDDKGPRQNREKEE